MIYNPDLEPLAYLYLGSDVTSKLSRTGSCIIAIQPEFLIRNLYPEGYISACTIELREVKLQDFFGNIFRFITVSCDEPDKTLSRVPNAMFKSQVIALERESNEKLANEIENWLGKERR